jgi:hypothetical protein
MSRAQSRPAKTSPLFSFDLDRTLTGVPAAPTSQRAARRATGPAGKARGGGDMWSEGVPSTNYVSDTGAAASQSDMKDQFVVFQLNESMEGPAVLNAEAVRPKLAGSDDEPDILTKLNLISFHVGDGENIDKGTRATMRINFGKDPSSTDRMFDTAFWAIAAGLKLYNDNTGQPAQTKELSADINRAFGGRPIEIPGGLGNLSFEVIKHEEPKWWQKVFSFLQSGAGQGMTSVLGFPAVTQTAIGIIDELVGRLSENEPEVLFKSKPMRLALTGKAHEEFTGGSPRVRLGSLNNGYCVLARYGDYNEIAASNAVFYPTHGLLAPASADPADYASLTSGNPLHGLTYAVFRVRMKTTALDPNFNFR